MYFLSFYSSFLATYLSGPLGCSQNPPLLHWTLAPGACGVKKGTCVYSCHIAPNLDFSTFPIGYKESEEWQTTSNSALLKLYSVLFVLVWIHLGFWLSDLDLNEICSYPLGLWSLSGIFTTVTHVLAGFLIPRGLVLPS